MTRKPELENHVKGVDLRDIRKSDIPLSMIYSCGTRGREGQVSSIACIAHFTERSYILRAKIPHSCETKPANILIYQLKCGMPARRAYSLTETRARGPTRTLGVFTVQWGEDPQHLHTTNRVSNVDPKGICKVDRPYGLFTVVCTCYSTDKWSIVYESRSVFAEKPGVLVWSTHSAYFGCSYPSNRKGCACCARAKIKGHT